jgi:cytochrome c
VLTRRLSFYVVVFMTCFLSAPAALKADDKPTESDAQQVALKAAALIQNEGIDAARNAFYAEGEFKYGEIYVNVITEQGIRLVYPPKPAAIDLDVLDAQDIDGKYLIKDIIQIAKTKGEGWTQYRWTNPTTKQIAAKVTYVKVVPERGVIVYVGVYK